MDGWLKDVAPGDTLRRWFGPDPEKWSEFRKRNNAEALKEYIEERAA